MRTISTRLMLHMDQLCVKVILLSSILVVLFVIRVGVRYLPLVLSVIISSSVLPSESSSVWYKRQTSVKTFTQVRKIQCTVKLSVPPYFLPQILKLFTEKMKSTKMFGDEKLCLKKWKETLFRRIRNVTTTYPGSVISNPWYRFSVAISLEPFNLRMIRM